MKRYKLILEDSGTPPIGKVTGSSTCREVLIKGWEMLGIQESFYVLGLSGDNQVIDKILISLGGTTKCLVDFKILFTRLLLLPGCVAFIVAHNHLSGNVKPSMADQGLTKDIAKAAKLLDFTFLDHLIVTGANDNYYSFAENGLI